MTCLRKPELVAPAGSWDSLHAALAGGADSVYFGVKNTTMRAFSSNFDILELSRIMNLIKSRGRKGYLALNTIIFNRELSRISKIMKTAKDAGVDAVILWDMAVFSLAQDMGLPVHISTQASVANIQAALFFARLGARRIILARECTLSDIAEIVRALRRENFVCEIEAFIHGAMCVSVSGRCFLSHYAHHESANRGRCLQPCRRKYRILEDDGNIEYQIGEDYILSPKDLCTVEFLDSLIHAGITAFKIEGRIRSPDYVKVVTTSYRCAIDACQRSVFTPSLKQALCEQLATVYNRGFSSGFYQGVPSDVSRNLEQTYEKIFLGNISKFYKKISVAEITVRSISLTMGEVVLVVGKSTPAQIFVIEQMEHERTPVLRAVRGQRIGVKIPFPVKPNDKAFIWRRKPLAVSS